MEREESERIRREARAAAERAHAIARRVRSMNTLYRERLEGIRRADQ